MPPEIVSLILDFLADDPDTLRVCALVSSGFLATARRLLFRHVFLLPMARQPAPRSSSLVAPLRPSSTLHPRSESLAPSPTTRPLHPCAQLDHLLAMSPDIAHHIHRLSIVDGRLFPSPSLHSDPLFPSLSPHSPRYFSLRDRLNGPHWFLSTPPRILSSLFQKLHLSALDLVFQDGPPVPWDSIPPDILTLLHSLWTSPTLQALQLRRVAWDSPAALSHFTRTLARGSVRHLTLHHVQLFSFPPLSPQHHARPRGRSPTPRTDTLRAKPKISYHPSPSNHLHPLHLDSLAITGPAAPTVLQSLFLDPHSLQKLSIPSDQFPHLLQFNMMTLQELILNDRLASEQNWSFSTFRNLRVLRLGVAIGLGTWLSQALNTLPPTVEYVAIRLIMDRNNNQRHPPPIRCRPGVRVEVFKCWEEDPMLSCRAAGGGRGRRRWCR